MQSPSLLEDSFLLLPTQLQHLFPQMDQKMMLITNIKQCRNLCLPKPSGKSIQAVSDRL